MNVYTSLEFRCITDDWLEVILMFIYMWALYFDTETLEIYYFMCSCDKDWYDFQLILSMSGLDWVYTLCELFIRPAFGINKMKIHFVF